MIQIRKKPFEPQLDDPAARVLPAGVGASHARDIAAMGRSNV
jgi:hypothetical protein